MQIHNTYEQYTKATEIKLTINGSHRHANIAFTNKYDDSK